jgi:hypothetical protein
MEIKIRMISAVSETINFFKKNPNAIDEDIFQNVSDFIEKESRRLDENTKIAMIASASKAYNIVKNNPKFSEKETLRIFIEQMPELMQEL